MNRSSFEGGLIRIVLENTNRGFKAEYFKRYILRQAKKRNVCYESTTIVLCYSLKQRKNIFLTKAI